MRSFSNGWKAMVCAAAVFALFLAPVGVMASTPTSALGADNSGIALVTSEEPGATASVKRFPRVNYQWPYSSGPFYGQVGRSQEGAAGVIRTQVGSFNLSSGLPFPEELRIDNQLDKLGVQYFIVQVHPDAKETGAELGDLIQAQGGEIVGTMPVNAVIARLTPAAYSVVQSTMGVMAVEPFHPAFKISPLIGRLPHPSPLKATSEVYSLEINLFRGEDAQSVAAAVAQLGGNVVSVTPGTIIADLHVASLGKLARLEAVQTIFENLPVLQHGEETTTAVQAGALTGRATPYHDAGIDGSGAGKPNTSAQVLSILDSGIQLDAGDLSDTRTSSGAPGAGHRKVRFYGTTDPYGGNGDFLGCDDIAQGGFTHGHVVAATAMGNATNVDTGTYGAGFLAEDPNSAGSFYNLDGVAPGAVLVAYDASNTPAVVNCGDPNLGVFLVGDLYSGGTTGSMGDGYSRGARIYNHSWGADSNIYSATAIDVDTFLRDKLDAMVFISAGNAGQDADNDTIPDPGSIGTPGTTKNGVSMGASGALDDQGIAANINERATFSSIGPAGAAGRIAPLLMAPGQERGTSGIASEFTCRSNDNNQTDPVECDLVTGVGGTSFSSPAAAGAALLVRDYFAQGFYPDGKGNNPGNSADQVDVDGGELSGAMVKATLIASAQMLGRNFSGQAPSGIDNVSITRRFNREQGYGRIQLDRVLPLETYPSSVSGLVVTDGVASGPTVRNDIVGLSGSVSNVAGVDTGTFTVCNTEEQLRVALVWMDPVGDALVNDLDLTLTAPSGEVFYGNYFTDDDNRDGVQNDVDCGGNDGAASPDGLVDSSRWSIPLSTCDPGSPHDSENPTEAIFLSPDPDGNTLTDDGLSQIEEGDWTVTVNHNGGAGSSPQSFAIAVSGGVCIGSSVRYDQSSYVCNDLATITVNELTDALDPATPLNDTDVRDRITLQVIGNSVCSDTCASCLVDTDCPGAATCDDGVVCDSETGADLYNAGLVFDQPDLAAPRFVMENIVLTDGTALDPGNGALDVRDGFRVQVSYQDDDGVGGAAPGDLIRISSAGVDCQVDLAFGTITFGQFGQDTTFDLVGGCERNARGLFEFGFPDLYMDAGETISYRFAYGSNENADLVNAEASLSCVLADADSPVDCLPGTGTCADPNRTNNADCSGILSVLDSPKTVGLIPAGASLSSNFTVAVDPALTGTPKIEMILQVSGATSGKTASSLAINRHQMNVDQVSLFYSTDFPTGGTENYDINLNDVIESPVTKIGDPNVDYVFESRTWSDLTAGGTINTGLQSPWNFDNNDGGFTSGLGSVTDDANINDIIAQWGEDKDFNGILSGRCVEDSSVACNRFPTDAINCPVTLDPNSTTFDRQCTNLENRDPVGSGIPVLDQNWSTLGGCGWQTKAPATCSGNLSVGCYDNSQCSGIGTCTGPAPSTGGVWHSGGISDRASSQGNPANCLYTGNNTTLGDCQSFETISGTDGVLTWFEVLLTPEIAKVNTALDGDGEPVYKAEILWWAWNQAVDLPDNNVAWTWEFDTDTASLEPLDLVSDLALLNFGFGGIGAVNGGSNPDLTNGFSMFAPITALGATTNGTLGNNRQGDNACFFEGAGTIAPVDLVRLGLPAPPDNDLLDGYCDLPSGDQNVVCTFVCAGGANDTEPCNVGADCTGGTCSSTADPNCGGVACIRGSSNIADVDQYVSPAGPARNMNIFAFNGPDMRFSTLEDIYGDTGETFQGAVGFLNFQADSTTTLPETGYGLAIDDMVVEWREFRLDEDTTSCAAGQCAVLSLGTSGFFQGSALIDVTLVEFSPYGERCTAEGTCTISGAACTTSGPCGAGEGNCESNVCFVGADCPASSCVASTNDCDGNAWYFDGGDDNDCDNNGTADIAVRATSASEAAGERIYLNLDSPNTYTGQLTISSSYDVPGVLLVQAQGATNDGVTIRYDDIDDGTGASICLNSVDPAAQGEVTAATTVSLTSGNVIVSSQVLSDNGDNDGFADDDETVSMRVELSNKTGVDLTGVTARLASNDPDIDCILDTFVSFGDLAADETRLSTDEFVFIVGQVGRLNDLDTLTGEFTVSISAEEFDNSFAPQKVILDLDLNAAGGSGPSSYSESFESGTFGSFTTMHIDNGLGSEIASEGYRCQYSDPDWVNSNSFGAITDCWLNPTAAADVYLWRIQNDKAYSGTRSLYFGIVLGPPLGFTSPFARLQAVRTTNPINLGWDKVCSVTRTTNCTTNANCPGGEECVPAGSRLTFKHQISMLDSRGVNVTAGETADRGVMHLQLANGAGTAVGDWIKLESIRNVYDQQGTDNYTNCMFDPIDDGTTEDDFFDATDPNRRLGPSSTCFPSFSWTYIGDTDLPFSEANIGNASDGPGLQGSFGVGTWIESEVPLDRFRGRRVRLRFLNTGLKLGGTTNVESAFLWNPDPRDDGWWIDDIRITDTLTSPATVSADTVDRSALPNCGVACSTVNASLSATPASLGAPGQVVTLDASASTADQCTNGVLQYRFSADNGNTLLRSWTDNPILVQAPINSTSYVVDVRCATLTTCSGSSVLPVSVGCPASGNLGGVFQTVVAPNNALLSWTNSATGNFAKGLLSGVSTLSTAGGGTGTITAATNFSIAADNPGAGAGFWYLFKNAAGGGSFCNELATWSSGGSGEDATPGRDSILP